MYIYILISGRSFCTPYTCFVLDAWRGSEYSCVQIVPNVLRHHKHLIGYFEFLDGSRIICFPLNIPEKLHGQHLFEKPEEVETHRIYLVNRMQYPCTLKSNIYYSNKQGTRPFFHLENNPALGHVLIYSVDKTHVLVVIVEFGCCSWMHFLSTLFQHWTSLLCWKDSVEAM